MKNKARFIFILTLLSANLLVVSAKPVQSIYRQFLNKQRANSIKKAFKFAWEGYSMHAFGHDELLPESNKYSDSR